MTKINFIKCCDWTGTKKELGKTKIDLERTKTDVNDLFIKLNGISLFYWKLNFNFLNCFTHVIMLLLMLLIEWNGSATSTDLETTKTNLASTRTELNSTKSAVSHLATELKGKLELKNLNLLTNWKNLNLTARTSELIDIGQMPTSCWDLEQMGHKLSGFFSVKGSKKMEMIYCNFLANQNGTTCFNFIWYCSSKSFLLTDKQKWIGYADVKSAPVYFYVQRSSRFNTTETPIPFELARVNEGNAMDLTTGIFTAPQPGIYFFSFTGVGRLYSSSSYAWFDSSLFLNGNLIGSSYVRENNTPVNQSSPVTLQMTLNLKTGDQVWVQIFYSGTSSYILVFGSNSRYTHFTGFMLEEEIAASLWGSTSSATHETFSTRTEWTDWTFV